MAALKTFFMADDIAWKDFVSSLDEVTTLNGTEQLAGIDSDGEKGFVTPEKILDYVYGGLPTLSGPIKQGYLYVQPSEILTFDSIPIWLLPAPGANKIHIPIKIIYNARFFGTAYTTNTTLLIGNNTMFFKSLTNFLAFSSSTIGEISSSASATSFSSGGVNEPIALQTSGAPLAGNGDLEFWITYYTLHVG